MKEPATIAIVGASARAAAFSALRAGYRVVTADLFADADLQQCCAATKVSPYPEGLQDWLAQSKCDGWMYTGAIENRPDLVGAMAEVRPLLGNSGEVLREVRDPRRLIECGLPLPETVESSKGLPLDGSWLCKTYRGSSGSGVWELVDEQTRQQAIEARAVFQRRVVGQLAAAVFVLNENWRKTLGVTQQWAGEEATGAKGFQYAGSVCVGEARYSAVEQQIDRISCVLAEQFGLRGLVGVDLVIEDSQVWLLEVNPRYTASVEILERSTGASSLAAHVSACSGGVAEDIEWGRREPKRTFGKAVLYAKRDVLICQEFYDWAIRGTGITVESGVADVPGVGSEIRCGQPVLTVFALGENSRDDRFLRRRVVEVESKLYDRT